MSYVLVPGEVLVREPSNQPRIPEVEGKENTQNQIRAYPTYGFQILATCRQAYREGVDRYYSENIFYLAPGHCEHSLRFLEVIQPCHRALLRHLAIRLSLLDIDQAMIDRISISKSSLRYYLDHGRMKAPKLVTALDELWHVKVRAVIQWLEANRMLGLVELRIECFSNNETRFIGSHHTQAPLRYNIYSVRSILGGSLLALNSLVMARERESDGWKGITIGWLEEKEKELNPER